ncbi:hypothetical protein MVEG_08735 [Podila verticillata NRRL 6337]|nr:hypothetical protein MVEG_08735 [Podila verticillata NRRL 6337]
MSLQVNFTTHGRELKAAYDAILRPADPKSGDNWAIFGYDKGSNDLKVLGQGAGGLEELEDEFVDGKIQYAFVRIIDPNSQLNKFILIAWCGDGVPESKKGLFNSHLADVSQFLKGYHLQINARSEFDVTPAQIMKRVNEGSGSKYSIHKETYEQERIRPLQSAYKKTEIPDIAALQRNPTKPESAPKYNIGSKPVVSTPPAKPAEPSWKSSSSAPSPPTSSSSSAASKIQSWNKISSGGSSYVSSTSSSFNKVAPPASLLNYGASQASTPNDPSMNKAQQIRLEREAREKEERERIAKEIRDREARERSIDDQSGAQKQAEERRLQEQREREQDQQRSQDRAREERAAREREERERSEAEDAARAAREAAKAREDAQARDRAAQAEEQHRQKEQDQRQREREEREESDRIAKQKKDEEAHRRKQEEEEEERRQQAEEERRQQEAADDKRRLEEEEHERRLQQEVNVAATKTLELGADALIASSAHPEVAGGSVSAVVLYSYEKAEENEMSLFEGEIITNVTELDVGWWSGESEDGTRSGLFPANYVEVIEHAHHAEAAPAHHEEEHYAHAQETHPEPAASHHVEEVLSSKPTAVALYDYNAGEPNEISFSEGDIIVEIDFVTEDWWSGHSQDGTRSGLFPSNYVELHQ